MAMLVQTSQKLFFYNVTGLLEKQFSFITLAKPRRLIIHSAGEDEEKWAHSYMTNGRINP